MIYKVLIFRIWMGILEDRKEMVDMKSFVPRDKMSKRARKKLDAQNRTTWGFNPTAKIVKSKKVYNRKKQPRNYEPYDSRGCFLMPYSA